MATFKDHADTRRAAEINADYFAHVSQVQSEFFFFFTKFAADLRRVIIGNSSGRPVCAQRVIITTEQDGFGACVRAGSVTSGEALLPVLTIGERRYDGSCSRGFIRLMEQCRRGSINW